jgi:hypothetical protein
VRKHDFDGRALQMAMLEDGKSKRIEMASLHNMNQVWFIAG